MFGLAETTVRIEGRHWFAMATTSLKALLLVPIELLWRLARHAVVRSREPDALAFLMIEKLRKGVRSFWLLKASVTLGLGMPLRY